jgi:spore germination protein GerM
MPRRAWIVALAIAVLAWVAWRVLAPREAQPPPKGAVRDTTVTALRSATLFFASDDADSLMSETRQVADKPGLRERVAVLVEELEKTPPHGGVVTLPTGTTLLQAYLDNRGSLTLDLSREFREQFRGGSSAEYMAVSSLVRTVLTNVPEARRVLLVCAGSPLATLGGHVPLDQPFDPSDWPRNQGD